MPDWDAIRVTLSLAACAAAACVCIGIPACALLSAQRSKLSQLADVLLYIPLAMPPIVIGLVLLSLFHAEGAVGTLSLWLGMEPPAFTFAGLVVAATVSAFPVAVRPMLTAACQVPCALLEGYQAIGASRSYIAWKVRVPFAMPGIITGAAVAFAHAAGQFGAIYLIGGNIAGETRTASIAIFDAIQRMDTQTAWATTLAMTGAVGAVLAAGLLLAKLVHPRGI